MTTKCELTDDMGERTREREKGGDAREVRDAGRVKKRGDMSHGLTKMKLRPVALTTLR